MYDMRYEIVIEINKVKYVKAKSLEEAQAKADEWAMKMGGEVMYVWEDNAT